MQAVILDGEVVEALGVSDEMHGGSHHVSVAEAAVGASELVTPPIQQGDVVDDVMVRRNDGNEEDKAKKNE